MLQELSSLLSTTLQEVQVLHDQMEMRSKALITLEDKDCASRTLVS
jgi:hypothetical protein